MGRVLILEDDRDLAIAWQLELENFDLEVVTVSHPDDAITLLSNNRYDLVVCDLLIRQSSGDYGGRGGLSVMSYIRLELVEKPLVVVVSGASDQIHVEQLAGLLKADATLRKPFTASRLASLVLELLGNSSAQSE